MIGEDRTQEHAAQARHLLIVDHAPSPNTLRLREAMLRGASDPEITGVLCRHRPALQAGAQDVRWADAVMLATTENFGYMSGALKDFFDRIYYPCLEHTEAMPYALAVRAGQDGTGTCRAVERITTGLKWRPLQAPLVMRGAYDTAFEQQSHELAMTLAASLEAGII